MIRRNFLLTACVLFIALQLSAQPVLRTITRLPDTGQQSGYTAIPGEDNDFTFNPPGFIDNLDGSVTDTVTGLQWQKTDGGEMTVESARLYVDTLSLGGYSDWRLPSPLEAFSILNLGKVNPALDTAYFTRSPAEYWWTAKTQYNDTTRVWVTNAGGGIGNHLASETISAGGTKRFHMRAVRDRTSPSILMPRFSVNGDGTITDQLTSLVWMEIPFADSLSWEDALLAADTLQRSGAGDWRMPNIRELQSIADYDRGNPSVDLGVFTGITTGKYWSSTSLPNQPQRAWYLDTRFGITTYADKTSRLLLLCVRGDGSFPTTVVDPFPEKTWSVFPNPAREEVMFSGVAETMRIRVLDILGCTISAWCGQGPFSVADWPAGYYLLIPEQEVYAPKRLIKY